MSVHEHKARARGPVKVAVLTVSTSRGVAEDRSGDLLIGRLDTAGHEIVDRRVVTDDVEAIRGALREVRLAGAQALLITGGTGLSERDVTPEALEGLFTRELPGFGELFRALSFQEIGAAAMLSRATAGTVRGMIVFALPGSVQACQLAIDKLILPELAHLVDQATKESAALVPKAEPTPSPAQPRLQTQQSGAGTAPEAGDPGGRWRAAVAAHAGRVETGPPPPLPDAVARLAPVSSVLDTAGERATLVLEDGRRLGLYGWPDLKRPTSKVIAIGDGGPLAEVVALHRHPTMCGTTVFGGLLPDPLGAADVAASVTGRAPKGDDPLFAVSGDAVWLRRGERAVRWDGRAERDDGTCKQVLASLLMDWHQR